MVFVGDADGVGDAAGIIYAAILVVVCVVGGTRSLLLAMLSSVFVCWLL